MKARINDYLYINSKRGRLTLDLEGDFRNLYDKLKDCDVEVKIEKYSPPKSKEAGAYAWVLIHKIAEKTRREPIVVYREFIRDFSCKTAVSCVQAEYAEEEIKEFVKGHYGRMVDVGDSKIPGCVVLHKKYGMSSFTREQMSVLIDILCDACRELEIETRPKEEIESLVRSWK